MRSRFLFLAVLVCVMAGSAASGPTEAERILERCRVAHASIPGLRAGFVMTSGSDTTRGEIHMRRPRMFRHQTPRSTVVTDGQSLWVYSDELDQVIITPAEGPGGDPPPMIKPPEGGTPSLAGVDTLEGIPCHVIDLRPLYARGPEDKIRLWIQFGTNLMARLEYHDPFSGRTTYTLTDMAIVADFPDSMFVYEPPPGAEVIDLREGGAGLEALLERLESDE